MAFTKVVGAGIHTLSNITSHNINSSGIITATKFVGPFDGSSGTFSGNITAVDATFTGNVSIAKTLTYEDVTNVDSVGIITARQGIFIDDSITHIGDTDTKIRFPAANQISFETTGSEAVRIDESGRVGIGHSNPSQLLTVRGNAPIIRIEENQSGGSKRLDLGVTNSGAVGYIGANQSASSLAFQTTNNERMRITSTGLVGIGTAVPDQTLEVFKASGTNLVKVSTQANSTIGIELEKTGSTTQTWRIADGQTVNGALEFYDVTDSKRVMGIDGSGRVIIGAGNHAGGSQLVIKGGDINSYSTLGMFSEHTNPADDTTLSQIRFGSNNTAVGAEIRTVADGQWALNDYPTRMQFYTTPDGSNSRQERLRITEEGYIGINETSPIHQLSIGINTATAWSSSKNISNTTNNDFIGLNIDNQNSGSNPEVGIMLQAGSSSSGQYTINCRKSAGNSADLILRTRDGGSASKETLRITADGKVGIGTDDPDTILHLQDSNHGAITLQGGTATSDLSLDFQTVAGVTTARIFSASDAGDLRFYTANTENLRIRSAGRVDVKNGTIDLGTADTSSGHINSKEVLTFNIDTDNDDTNRSFKFCTNASDGGGTTLFQIDEGGKLTCFDTVSIDSSAGHIVMGDSDLSGGAVAVDPYIYLRMGSLGNTSNDTEVTALMITDNNSRQNQTEGAGSWKSKIQFNSTQINGNTASEGASIVHDITYNNYSSTKMRSDLVFKTRGDAQTASSDAATEKLRIMHNGEVRINGDGSGGGYLRVLKDRDTAYSSSGGNNQDLIVQQFSDGTNTGGYSCLALQANYTGQTGAWVAIHAVRTGVGTADLTINPRNNSTGDVERLRITSAGAVLPGDDNTQDLGASGTRWANVYSADVHLNNTGTGGNEVDGSEGSWTMQEGADDLFLINRITGKKYKFNLTEV